MTPDRRARSESSPRAGPAHPESSPRARAVRPESPSGARAAHLESSPRARAARLESPSGARAARARRVQIANRQDALSVPAASVRALVRLALANVSRPGDVSVSFVGDAEMRRLNRDFHAQDRTTDVLSFPMEEEALLAEIVVCTDRARAEARKRGIAPERELLLYVVHGALHIAGFDDHDPSGRRRMRRRERELLEAMPAVRNDPRGSAWRARDRGRPDRR